MVRVPLPDGLRGTAVRSSRNGALGIARSRLRRSDIQHPFRGVVSAELDVDDIRARCLSFLPVMEPGQVFSHLTALALLGAPLPRQPGALHVSVAFPRTPPRREGIVGHSLSTVDILTLGQLPVAHPASAWAQSAALLGREDLVAIGDYLVTGPRRGGERMPGLCGQEELTTVSATWRRRPGSGRLTWASERVRVGVDSRPESLLRLLLVRFGLPEPIADFPVDVGGGLILHPDLAYPEQRLALEYEGEHHFTDRQTAERDIERRELFADVNWRTIRVTSPQLFGDPVGLVARVERQRAR